VSTRGTFAFFLLLTSRALWNSLLRHFFPNRHPPLTLLRRRRLTNRFLSSSLWSPGSFFRHHPLFQSPPVPCSYPKTNAALVLTPPSIPARNPPRLFHPVSPAIVIPTLLEEPGFSTDVRGVNLASLISQMFFPLALWFSPPHPFAIPRNQIHRVKKLTTNLVQTFLPVSLQTHGGRSFPRFFPL